MALVLSPPARAADPTEVTAVGKDTARTLLDQGDALYKQEDYAGALEKYRAADEIMGVPTTGVEVGRALEALGRLVEARDAYLRVLRFPKAEPEPEAFTKARSRAKERGTELAGRIAQLTLVVEGAEGVTPTVKVDGVTINAAVLGQPMSVDPGERAIEVDAPGRLPVRRTVSLQEGGSERLILKLEIDPNAVKPPEPIQKEPPRPPPLPPAVRDEPERFPVFATVGFSLGAAGLVVGGVMGALSLTKTADLDAPCGGDTVCPVTTQAKIDEAALFANISNVGFAVGGAGVLFGVIALFTLDAPDETKTALTPLVGPGSLGLRGRF